MHSDRKHQVDPRTATARTAGRFVPLTLFAAVALLLSAPVRADADVSVGSISLNADFPLPGEQSIAITNLTGLCIASYPACSNLALTDWTLTVDYTSTFYNQPGNPALASPYVVQWQNSANDIEAGSSLLVPLDLCNGAAVGACGTPTTAVSSVSFQGEISPASFVLYDPTANGGAGGPGALFSSNGGFSVTFTPTAGFPAHYYEALDITVGPQTSVVPEPDCKWLLGIVAAFYLGKRCRRAHALKQESFLKLG